MVGRRRKFLVLGRLKHPETILRDPFLYDRLYTPPPRLHVQCMHHIILQKQM